MLTESKTYRPGQGNDLAVVSIIVLPHGYRHIAWYRPINPLIACCLGSAGTQQHVRVLLSVKFCQPCLHAHATLRCRLPPPFRLLARSSTACINFLINRIVCSWRFGPSTS